MLFTCGLFLSSITFAQKSKSTTVATEESTSTEAHSGLKLGWINSAQLLEAMPERIKADSEITKFARSYQEVLEGMQKELQTKFQQYRSSEKTMSDAMKETMQNEIQDLQARMESTNTSAKEKVQAKQQEIFGPILEKADKAIKSVAKERSYDYIFDANASGGSMFLLYSRESDNILPLVKAKLGLK